MSETPSLVRIYRADGTVPLPSRGTAWSAGYDLTSNLDTELLLLPFTPYKIPTGVFLGMNEGLEAQIRPRSSLSAKGIHCALGTVDADYRGELTVVMMNLTPAEDYFIVPKQRIAQLVFSRLIPVRLYDVPTREELGDTERGTGGFGSTGAF